LTGVVEGAFVGSLAVEVHILTQEGQAVLVELLLDLVGRGEGGRGGVRKREGK
jgi:hypothetical protein